MRVLITGGAGFIGSHVVDLLCTRGDEVVVLDNLDPQVHGNRSHWEDAWPDYLPDRGNLNRVVYDITNVDLDVTIADLDAFDACIHLAAKVGVGQSATDPDVYAHVNAYGTANLLRALQRHPDKIKRLVVASSMSCYGEGAYAVEEAVASGKTYRVIRPPLREGRLMAEGAWDYHALDPIGISEVDALNPTSIYAETKATTERMSLIWGSQQGVPTAALRFFNVYGPRQALRNPYTGVAAIFASALLRGQAPVVYEDGRQTRDFVHVHDVARAVVTLLDNEHHGPVNVGTGEATSIGGLADALCREINPMLLPKITGQYRAGDVRHCIANANLLRSMGWEPEVDFLTDGVRGLAEWAKQHVEEAEQTRADPHAEMKRAGLLLGGDQ